MHRTEHATGPELEKLSDTGLILADEDQDIRGRKIIDPHGDDVGHVSNLFIDARERKVRLLEVSTGGFLGLGERHALLPIDAILRIAKDAVYTTASRDLVMRSPAYDPTLIQAPVEAYWEPFYGYYGLSPYWGSGYMYPDFPLSLERRRAVH